MQAERMAEERLRGLTTPMRITEIGFGNRQRPGSTKSFEDTCGYLHMDHTPADVMELSSLGAMAYARDLSSPGAVG